MANKLKNLVITKVALVDEGSCSAAHIKLYKRKGGQEMGFDEILKSLTPEQQATVKAEMVKQAEEAKKAAPCPICGKAAGECTCKADKTEMEKKCGDLKKSKEDLEAEVAKLKNPEAKSEEEILKGLDPAVRDLFEKSRKEAAAANAAILKMKEDSDKAEALAKAKELNNIGTPEDQLAESLKVLKSKDEKVFEDVFAILKTANSALANSNFGGAAGSDGAGDNSGIDFEKAKDAAWGKIEAAAATIAKSKNVSLESAISLAIQENPTLYTDYMKTMN